MASSQQFCTFFLDGHFFGTPVPQVQEVIQNQVMTRVPLAPNVVGGMINLRGQIVSAIDLRRRLGLQDRPDGQLPMNVVVRTSDGAVSLLVDEIGDVIEVDEDTLESPPETLRGFAREVLRGVYKLSGRLLLALDIDRVVDLGDFNKLKNNQKF
ncbi:MAG TPA: chemotaxis protein CheW [Candidatus Sulfotelmatobacter sp.]|jgi:purine-binding chemotaxis protein CheW|nr:chemotaxis protein CheW [Candidatus Sulfotelmatobacter sp.]